MKEFQRLKSIDALRGLAVILMIQQHLGVWFTFNIYETKIMLAFNALGGLAAPIFITLAGVGSILINLKHKNNNKLLMKRGFLIILLGYLLNLLTPSWFSPGSWYVLHLIGFCLLLSPFLKKIPIKGLFLFLALVLFATIVIQDFLKTPPSLSNNYMKSLNHPGGIFRLALAEGQFPLFPWLAFFLSGLIAGKFIISKKIKTIAIMGGAFLLLALTLSLFDKIFNLKGISFRFCHLTPHFYPALTPITLILISSSLFILAFFLYLETKEKKIFPKALVSTGRLSISFLFLHVPIFRESALFFNFWQKMPSLLSSVIICLLLALFIKGALFWGKKSYKYSLEWIIRKI